MKKYAYLMLSLFVFIPLSYAQPTGFTRAIKVSSPSCSSSYVCFAFNNLTIKKLTVKLEIVDYVGSYPIPFVMDDTDTFDHNSNVIEYKIEPRYLSETSKHGYELKTINGKKASPSCKIMRNAPFIGGSLHTLDIKRADDGSFVCHVSS